MVEILWLLKTEVYTLSYPKYLRNLEFWRGLIQIIFKPYTIIYLWKPCYICVTLISNNFKHNWGQFLSSLTFFQISLSSLWNMASMTPLHSIIPNINTPNSNTTRHSSFAGSTTSVSCNGIIHQKKNKINRSSTMVVSAVGDVSADSTIYLVGGAIAVALVGTAFPIFFSRKDT